MGIQNEKEKRGPMFKLYKTPIIVAVVMLFLALLDLPIGYYTLLRIVVCGTAIYLSFVAKEIKKLHWVWIMGFIGILFNPFIPIHLDKEIWTFIDIIVGFIFLIGMFIFMEKKKWAWIVSSVIACLAILIIAISMIDRIEQERSRLLRQKLAQQKYDEGSDFVFQNKNFKVTLLTPYRALMQKYINVFEEPTEPAIKFKFVYEVISENEIVYIADTNDKSSLKDNFGNSYAISQDYWNYRSRDVGKFMHGHRGEIILYTTDNIMPNATYLYLELRLRRFGRDIHESVPHSSSSLTSLFNGRRFVIPISSIITVPPGFAPELASDLDLLESEKDGSKDNRKIYRLSDAISGKTN
jgi:uncharacterized membrane protein